MQIHYTISQKQRVTASLQRANIKALAQAIITATEASLFIQEENGEQVKQPASTRNNCHETFKDQNGQIYWQTHYKPGKQNI